MVNYQNGKIYKMLMPDGYFYIGCTCNELRVRKQMHKKSFNKNSQGKLYIHIRKNCIEWNDIHMILFELYPCKERSELLLRESQVIREHFDDKSCLNTFIFSRQDGSNQKMTNEKRKNDRIENIDEYRKHDLQRYNNQRREKMLEKIQCVCGVTHCRTNIRKHERTAKHLKWISENPQ